MPARRERRTPPGWPALMSEELAALYCDVSRAHFRTHCPCVPVKIGASVRYLIEEIDTWRRSLPRRGSAPARVDRRDDIDQGPSSDNQPDADSGADTWLRRFDARQNQGSA